MSVVLRGPQQQEAAAEQEMLAMHQTAMHWCPTQQSTCTERCAQLAAVGSNTLDSPTSYPNSTPAEEGGTRHVCGSCTSCAL